MPWKPKQNLSRSKLPKGFSTNKQTWVKLSVLSRSNHSRQQATLQHTLCFSRSGLSQRMSLGVQFKYCLKVTKTKEGFLSKLQTGFQSWRNSEKRSTEDQKLSFGSQTVEMFPNCSNNVRFPTKTSQLSTTKRDECNRSVGCARWVSQNDLCFIEHPKTFKSISSTDDIRSNQNYKLRSVHSQSFQVKIGSSTDDTWWNQNCATSLISQRYTR